MIHAGRFGLRFAYALIIIAAGLMAAGCGGGSGQASSSTGDATRQGSLEIQVLFPQPVSREAAATGSNGRSRYQPGDIPDGALSLKILLVDPTSGSLIAPARIVTSPIVTGGSLASPVTINFAALPLGPVRVDVTAHPDAQATDTPLATGSGTATVAPQTVTPVHIPLTLTGIELTTVSRIHLSPSSPGKLTARVLDKNENLVKMPLRFTSGNTARATVPATGTSGVQIDVTAGTDVGPVVITVLEPDSGLTTSITFIVDPGP